ncbi:GNAT family N-acetyltransferase [Pseudomonas viridiflava]|uniref:GNAT family N-acetyltransferase n=1 Tax=Pseudomonas viridiflava TaxID=33069 RepID=UPI0013C374C6|nr:GNAT family N-acetyltransferase [Pseudomonas viridiflava]
MPTSTASSIQIDRFEHADQQGVVDVILPIQREEFGIAITAEDQPDLQAIPDFYQVGNGDFWVAKQDGRVIGTIGLKDIGAQQTALRKMFVAAPFRGREFGVAAKLLSTLLEEAWRRGVKDIYLGTTDKFLAAHRFYEKHGFAEVAKDDLPASFPVMKVDSKFYVLRRV